MKIKKILSGFVACAVAATALSTAVFAEDLVIKPNEDGKKVNLQKVGILNGEDCTGDVKVNTLSWDGLGLGPNEGLWMIGGDNGNAGITIEMLKSYEKLEVAYTCDDPLEGTKIGLTFKLHLDESKQMTDEGGYAFNDYLPADWIGYGPDGSVGKGKTYNALEAFGSSQIEAEGVISIKTADIIANLGTDIGDYFMGIGIGVDNTANAEEDEETPYTIEWQSISLVGGTGTADDTTPAADDTTPAADDTTPAADDTTAGGTTDKPNTDTGIEGVAVIAGLAILATGAIIVSKKRK